MKVNVLSESAFTVGGHGVHSVYEDNLESLRGAEGVEAISDPFRKADLVHLHTVGPLALLCMYTAPCTVVTAHLTAGSLVGSIAGCRPFRKPIEIYLRWFYNKADHVIAVSEHTREELRRMGVKRAISVVPNKAPTVASTPTKADSRKLLALPQGQPVVLTVGQVQPRKGVSTFHEVAASMPDALFVWVGGFPFGILTSRYFAMRRLLRSRPGNVVHSGQLSRDDVKAYFCASDVYFHPSHHELAPMAVLEAANHGLPLVLRDLACYRQLLGDTYLAGNDGTFTQKLRNVIDSEELRKRMSSSALSLAEEGSASRTARALLVIYEELLNSEEPSLSLSG